MKRTRTVLIALGAAALASLCYWGTVVREGGSDELQTVEAPAPADSRSAGGIEDRRVDPALTPGEWIAPDADTQAVKDAAASAVDYLEDLIFLHPDAGYTILDEKGWIGGRAVEDDEFSDKILECQLQHEPGTTKPCRWLNRIVIKRTGADTGQVAYHRAEFRADNPPEPACIAWAGCAQEGWKRRQAPLPSGATEDYLGMTNAGNGFSGGLGRSGEEYIEYYEKLLEEARKDVEKWKAFFDEDPVRSHHNYHFHLADMLHIERLLEKARKRWD
jgi:hypothetical protein